MQLMEVKDATRKTIKRIRQCFIYKSNYFQLETYVNIEGFLSLLKIQTNSPSPQIEIPPYIEVIREVTDDPGYMAHCLAKIDYYIYPEDVPLIKDVDSDISQFDYLFKDTDCYRRTSI